MQKWIILLLTIFSVLAYSQKQTDSLSKTPVDSLSVLKTDSVKTIAIQDSLVSAVKDSLEALKKHFENFEYGEVIKGSTNLLSQKKQFSNSDLFSIYRMKSISHFSLTEDEAAKNSFIEILKIDTSYVLDTLKTSPKIVAFFNDVKKNYLQQIAEKEAQQIVKVDTLYISDTSKYSQIENSLKTSAFLSLIYPGAGHLYEGQKTKGWVLTTLTTISLTSTIYFFIDADKKRKSYIDEKQLANLDSKYADYNKSFEYRNYSIIALGAIWLYSQLDLLFFSDNSYPQNNQTENSVLSINPFNGIQLNLKLNF